MGSLVLINGLDVLGGEVAHSSVTATPPTYRVRAVNEFDDISTHQAQLRRVVGVEVKESVGVMGTLGEEERERNVC